MRRGMTLDEALKNPILINLVKNIKQRYPTKVYLIGGIARFGFSEHDIDFLIEIVKGQDGSKLIAYLDSICEQKQKPPHTFGYRLRFRELPFKIDIMDTDYYPERVKPEWIRIEFKV